MKKSLFAALTIAAVVVILVFVLVGCDMVDRSVFPDGYVEVTDLKVKSANVYLSPNGDTSTYQLEVEVLPENANRALSYYVPARYLQYITVSEDGLITAKEVTPEGVVIPLKVTSKTNKNAYLTINVVVEEVEVERIYFDLGKEGQVVLNYNGAPVQLEPIYEPAHAQDGRALNYVSSNPDVCTVNSDGVVTPIGGGHAYVTVTGQTLAGKEIRTQVPVFVKYTPGAGQYRLDVSDSAPAYRQVLGDFKPIRFNLVKLNEEVNPNVDVYWFVDQERVLDMNGSWQYEHVPTVTSQTSYRVRAVIKANDEPEIVLYSEEIVIYRPFNGYELSFGNESQARQAYLFGTEQTFALTAGQSAVEKYDWYIRRLGEGGRGERIATTLSTDRDLSARLNVEGDFVLTAVGRDGTGYPIAEKEFEFSVTRPMKGDVLIVEPQQIDDGLPPESYDFYLTEYAEDGTAADPVYIGATGYGERFLYPLDHEGRFSISSRAILDGVVAKVNGEEYQTETEVFHVYDKEEPFLPTTEDLVPEDSRYAADYVAYVPAPVLSAIYDDGAVSVVRWAPSKGVPSYVVEVTDEGGETYLFDSDADRTYFGNNYIVLPADIVTPSDKYSVRVKQKGGVYSERYYYGYTPEEGREEYYFDAIPADLYGYLAPASGVLNGYLTSVADLGSLLNYTVLYGTGSGRRIDEIDYKVYNLSVYFAFDYVAASLDYPTVLADGITEEYEAVYCVTLGAQTAYAPTGYYRYAFSARADGGYDITLYVAEVAETSEMRNGVIVSEEIKKVTTESINYAAEPYGKDNEVFLVNTRKKLRVYDSEQLFYALSNGYAVNPANDVVLNLYGRITLVVNKVVSAEMSDGQKALAFYDYLTHNVVFDEATKGKAAETSVSRYASNRLEGAFLYGQATAEGMAKAYVALCAVEGIPCVKVAGEINGETHYWNKVFFDGEWTVVDLINGGGNADGVLFGNHEFFGLTDEGYGLILNDVREIGEYPTANGAHDYYAGEIHDRAVTVSEQGELESLINSFVEVKGMTAVEVAFDILFADTPETISAAVNAVENSTPNEVTDILYLEDNRVVLILE